MNTSKNGPPADACRLSYVHEQPWPASGVAAVVGLFCGLLMFRR